MDSPRPSSSCSCAAPASAGAGGHLGRCARRTPRPPLSTLQAAQPGLAHRGLRVRRQDAARLHPDRRPRPARRVQPVPGGPQAGDGRDRGRALLQAQGRRLRGHHPRRGQERDRQAQDRAGRLDADDAARPQLLYTQDDTRGGLDGYKRKIKEAKLARDLEAQYSKKWVVGKYLNTVPYGTVGGQSAIGAGAAARLYFNKRVQDLTLREAAMLAGMPQAPSTVLAGAQPERHQAAPQRGAGQDGRARLHHPRDGARAR